jgi:hypothetical protein
MPALPIPTTSMKFQRNVMKSAVYSTRTSSSLGCLGLRAHFVKSGADEEDKIDVADIPGVKPEVSLESLSALDIRYTARPHRRKNKNCIACACCDEIWPPSSCPWDSFDMSHVMEYTQACIWATCLARGRGHVHVLYDYLSRKARDIPLPLTFPVTGSELSNLLRPSRTQSMKTRYALSLMYWCDENYFFCLKKL